MKSKTKKMGIIIGMIAAVNVIGLIVVLGILPVLLGTSVYDISESSLYEREEHALTNDWSVTEIFQPKNKYLKSVSVFICPFCELDEYESDDVFELHYELKNASGKVIRRNTVKIYPDNLPNFIDISLETWVNPGSQYSLECTILDTDGKIGTVLGPQDIGPMEHQDVIWNGEEIDRTMYFKYVYGNFSKKLLLCWMLPFTVLGYYLSDILLKRISKKNQLPPTP